METSGPEPGGSESAEGSGTTAGRSPRTSPAGRMFVDAGGAFSFFDAVFAVAMTLLVTTIAPGPDAWTSWSSLWNSIGDQLTAFALSFLLIGVYWWTNRRFLTSLRGITPRLVFLNLLMLAFVVLLPVSTNAMGERSTAADEVATVVYALNIAAISSISVIEYLVARHQRLLDPAPDRRQSIISVVDGALVPVVFLVSIPIAVWVSPDVARWSWISLLVLGPISGRIERRSRTGAEATARASTA